MLVRGVWHQCDDGIIRPVILLDAKDRKRFSDFRSDNSQLQRIEIFALRVAENPKELIADLTPYPFLFLPRNPKIEQELDA